MCERSKSSFLYIFIYLTMLKHACIHYKHNSTKMSFSERFSASVFFQKPVFSLPFLAKTFRHFLSTRFKHFVNCQAIDTIGNVSIHNHAIIGSMSRLLVNVSLNNTNVGVVPVSFFNLMTQALIPKTILPAINSKFELRTRHDVFVFAS